MGESTLVFPPHRPRMPQALQGLRRSRKAQITLLIAAFLYTLHILAPLTCQHTHLKCKDMPIAEAHWRTSTGSSPYISMPAHSVLAPGDSICIRVVVPPTAAGSERYPSHVFRPLPDTGWDSVMVDLVGRRTDISVPVQLAPAPDARNAVRDSTHIYEADVILRDVDEYTPSGVVEYRNAQWNYEPPTAPVAYTPEPLQSAGIQITVRGPAAFPVAEHTSLPLCTAADEPGRWMRASDLPFNTNGLPASDNRGKVWLPYTCRLRDIAYSEAARCLHRNYTVSHWLGDSNMRRALKKLTTLGLWCSSLEHSAARWCVCEDLYEPFDRFDVWARDSLIYFDQVHGGQTRGAYSAESAIIRFRKLEGLNVNSVSSWAGSFVSDDNIATLPPSLLIVGLVNWDTAMSSFSSFAGQLDSFLHKIEEAYNEDTLIVVRTGQYYCCRHDVNTKWKRRYSRMRNKAFNRYMVDAFKRFFAGTRRVVVWDVSGVAEARSLDARRESADCGSNHVRSELVEVENQILFNALCN